MRPWSIAMLLRNRLELGVCFVAIRLLASRQAEFLFVFCSIIRI